MKQPKGADCLLGNQTVCQVAYWQLTFYTNISCNQDLWAS